jgi:hypothetical protein
MSVDLVNPPDGAKCKFSPVELVAKVTVRGQPFPDVRVTFTIGHLGTTEADFDIDTDTQGMAKLTFPARSGNFTWRVTAKKSGYPVVESTLRSFSITLSLTVDGLSPSSFILALSPVRFVARVTGAGGSPVESANVTFYVDSAKVGSTLTDTRGLAKLASAVEPAEHIWFASAIKDGEGGISDITRFMVGSTLASTTRDHDSRSHGPVQDVHYCLETALVSFDSKETLGRSEVALQVNHDEQFDCPEPVA